MEEKPMEESKYPPQIRFKQITVFSSSGTAILYGLTADGEVWTYSNLRDGWVPFSMKQVTKRGFNNEQKT